jgi:septum site-determining protein MinC
MTAKKRQLVTIKGTKDGLVFHLHDECNFEALLRELKRTLEETHQQFLTGPIVHVYVKLGARSVNEAQKERIRDILRHKGNLLIQSIESDAQEEAEAIQRLQPVKGIVRSGQTLLHGGDLLFLGDVNPGGTIVCTGSIYILGALRGIAHAGSEGDESAVIAASLMKPMQLRIAGVVSRPPDEWVTGDGYMEFAYIKDGVMELDKMNHMQQLVP